MSQSKIKEEVSRASLQQGSLNQPKQDDSDTDNWEFSDDDNEHDEKHDPSAEQAIPHQQQMTGQNGGAPLGSEMTDQDDIPGYAKVNKGQTAFCRESVSSEDYDTSTFNTHSTESRQDKLVPQSTTEVEGEAAIDSSTTEEEDAQDQDPINQLVSENGTTSDSEEEENWPMEQKKKLQTQHSIDIGEQKSLQGPGQEVPSAIKVKTNESASNSTISPSTKTSESERDTALIDSLPPKERKEEIAATTVIFQGILQKQGGRHKSWKFRYFRLFPGVLRYYTTKIDMAPIHEIKLDGARVLVPPGSTKRPYQFTLETKNSWNKRSEYILAASSEAEQKEWITALKRGGKMQKKTEFGTYDRRARTGTKGATYSPATSPEASPPMMKVDTTHVIQPPSSPVVVRKQLANISSTQAAASPVLRHRSETENQGDGMKTATESLKVVAASAHGKEFLGMTVELQLPGNGKDRPLSAMRMRSVEEVTEQHHREKKQSKTHLRHFVSKQKKRYVEGAFDLDLTCKTFSYLDTSVVLCYAISPLAQMLQIRSLQWDFRLKVQNQYTEISWLMYNGFWKANTKATTNSTTCVQKGPTPPTSSTIVLHIIHLMTTVLQLCLL
jgi:hypothetical protein